MNLLRKLNQKQIVILGVALLLVVVSLIVWQAYGGQMWTKSQVLVEVKDEIFDTTYKEWKDQFVLGLEYTLLFDGVVGVIGLAGAFILRDKG